jgi:hypothetical protein
METMNYHDTGNLHPMKPPMWPDEFARQLFSRQRKETTMPFDVQDHNDEIMSSVQRHHLDGQTRLTALITRHPDVRQASNQALAAGVPWATIIATILPFVIQIIAGGKIDWQAIVAAIIALINPPAPPLHAFAKQGRSNE